MKRYYLNSQQPDDKAARYRQLAQENRKVAQWISLRGAREALLEAAQQLEMLAEEEDRRAQGAAPVQCPKPEA
jgi:hypothetical protein